MKSRRLTALMMVMVLALFSFVPMVALPNEAYAGKLFPPKESFTPGTWFLGDTPPNYDPNKPPIVFVQGKSGAADDWYKDTVYHGANDMYETAYNAGYQAVFVQLYDAARQGSRSQWDNGRLLATMLGQIYNHFGKKVNIVAHSKGGPDTQAALVHYGAHQFVGKVVTLGSPHHGSHLADLSYSWWAGWLASLLGQKDDGTYSLQTGEMAKFRSQTDSHVNVSKNKYYTVAGTSWGPAFSALATGGLYLSSYGSNDGLVNEWSTKLKYGTHLFTDSKLDHDSIRIGSRVFSRIEPQLRTSTFTVAVPITTMASSEEPIIESANNQVVLGGPITQKGTSEKNFAIDRKTDATLSVLTATPYTKVHFVSPSGKVYTNKNSKVTTTRDQDAFRGAYVQTFHLKGMEAGQWRVQLKNIARNDAFLLVGTFADKAPFSLGMAGKTKQSKAKFFMKQEKSQTLNQAVDVTIRVVDAKGALISETKQVRKVNAYMLEGLLPQVAKSGVYNVTIDLKGKANGKDFTRTLVRSIYIEK